MKKRIAAGLLALVMVFSLVIGSRWLQPDAEAAETETELTLPASDTSNQVEWSIDENGHLEISGTGDWARHAASNGNLVAAPWYDYNALITSAKVTLSGAGDLSYMFYDCRGLTSLDLSGLDTRNVRTMKSMFAYCYGLTSLDVGNFDTSSVTDMNAMFCVCSGLTSLDVSGFDTSNVTDMALMFYGCSGLTSLDLSSFDTSNVTGMEDMLFASSAMTTIHTPLHVKVDAALPEGAWKDEENNIYENLPKNLDTNIVLRRDTDADDLTDPSEGDKTEVTLPASDTSNQVEWSIDENGHLEVSGTGDWASHEITITDDSASTRYSVPPWYDYRNLITSAKVTLSGATDLSYMFSDCDSLTNLDLSSFDTSGVTDMSYMFSGCDSLTSLDVSGFDTSCVTDMAQMFWGCPRMTSLDVSGFDTGSVTNMSHMFYGCCSLAILDVSGFDTSNVTDMSYMFDSCSSLASLDVSGFDTSCVTDMSFMFLHCGELTSLDVSGFDTSCVTNMFCMFIYCGELTSLDVSGFDTSSVTDMALMFCDCKSLTSLDLSSFDTSSVTNMSHMFYGCSGLTSLDVSGFGTSSVTNMDGMFYGCSSLTSLDLSSFDTSSVTRMDNMFYDCSSLTSIQTPLHVENKVTLPDGVWKDEENNAYENLPENLNSSIVLRRNTDAEDSADPSEENKTDAEKIAEAKTTIEAALAEIKGDNDTSKEKIQSVIDKALTDAGITDVTATVDSFEKTEATSSQEGSLTGSVTLTTGSESGKVDFEKTIEKLPKTDEEDPKADEDEPKNPSEDDKKDEDKTDEEKVAKAKIVLEEALPEIKVVNTATEKSIQSLIEKLLNEAGITGVTVTLDNFKKVEATNDSEGMLTATVTLTAGNESYKLEINKAIAKLRQTDADAPADPSDDNKTDTEKPANPSGDNKGDNKTDTGNSATPANSSGNPANANKTNPTNAANAADSTKTAESSEIPARKMGDETNVLFYLLLAIASAVGAGCAIRRMQSKCSKEN